MATFKRMDSFVQDLRIRPAEFWLLNKKECNMLILLNFSVESRLSLVSHDWLYGGTICLLEGAQVTRVKSTQALPIYSSSQCGS